MQKKFQQKKIVKNIETLAAKIAKLSFSTEKVKTKAVKIEKLTNSIQIAFKKNLLKLAEIAETEQKLTKFSADPRITAICDIVGSIESKLQKEKFSKIQHTFEI